MSRKPKISETTGPAARLTRRRLLAAAPALAAAALAADDLAAPAVAQDVTRWRLVTAWPMDAPGPGTSARRIAERITALSGGRLEIELYAAGELVPAFEVLDAVSQGTAELGHAAAFFWAGKLPPAVFFIAVPFGLSPEAHNAWIYEGGGQALYDALYAPLGVKPLLAGNSGLQMGGWYRREIKSLEDVKGLKIRMPGVGGEVMRRLGATAVSVPPGEIFPALQAGTVDAAEFLGPWSDLAMGFDRVAPFYYWPGFHEPNGSAEALVNAEALAALPADLQALVAVVCEAENARGLAEADWMNAVSLDALQSSSEVKLRRFPDDVLAAARWATGEVLAELAGGDAEAKRIYDSYRQAQRISLAWDRVGRHALAEAKLA